MACDDLLWHSCDLHHSPLSITPYAVECLFEVYEVVEDSLAVRHNFFKYLSHCEKLFCFPWPKAGFFISKCSFKILFHSVLYQFGENFPWNAL